MLPDALNSSISATDQTACSEQSDRLEQAFATVDADPWFAQTLNEEALRSLGHSISDRRQAYEKMFGVDCQTAIGWMVDELADHGDENGHPLRAVQSATLFDRSTSADDLRHQIARLAKQSVACAGEWNWLNEQWLQVELPLTIAYFFAFVESTETLVELAAETMANQFDHLLDTDGWPAAGILPDYGPLAASWFRCLQLLDALDADFSGHAFDRAGHPPEQAKTNSEINTEIGDGGRRVTHSTIHEAAAGLHRHLLRLMRKNRSLMMAKRKIKLPQTLIAAMIQRYGGPDDWSILERTVPSPIKPRPPLVGLDRSRNAVSEWGNSLLFHDGWERKSSKLAATFDQHQCLIELGKAIPLISGNTLPTISFNGDQLSAYEPPEVLVSLCDDQIAFAEVQWKFDHGVRLQRHIMLSMEDRFALIGDAVGTDDAGKIDYFCRWPLANGIAPIAETETTEHYLFDGKKIRGLVIPAGLPEWKSERSSGKMIVDSEAITMRQTTDGAAIHVPIFFDLDPKRSKLKRTWRQLTVAEQLTIVRPEVAVAYRIQVNKQQFVFYRSLAETGNRTFFGQNVNNELFLGRLEKDRSMTELLQVE